MTDSASSNAPRNPSTDQRPTVAFVLDRTYVPWAGMAMLSCHESNDSSGCDFELLHDGSLDSEQSEQLSSVLEGTRSTVRFHAFSRDRIATLPSTSDFGPIVWLRFFLPEVLWDRSRVLYLDSDVFVNGPISDLWESPLGEHPIGAVANVVEPGLRDHVRRFGVRYPGGFFNSGVLVMDLDAMREADLTQKLLGFAVSNAEMLLWPDQDTLNAVFKEDWKSLHPRWNAQNSYWTWYDWALEVFGKSLLDEAIGDPRVRHFEGPSLSKPWHYLCSAPMVDDYRRLLAKSPWASLPLEDRTLATHVIKRLPQRRQVEAYKRLLRIRARLSGEGR